MGQPYLTRRAFTLLGETMADQILLVLAFIDGRAVAGALNFIGGTCLYGRYWGALVDKPFLHFELCYYQAIDAAIALGLSRVEAGAQGATSWRAAMSRSAPFPPITSRTPVFARRWPIS
jgi:predicted N-acyltransferase